MTAAPSAAGTPADRGWRLKVVLAFATLYLVWGSTYLAIRVGVLSLPPALFAGARFLIAGVLLIAAAALAGQRLPDSAAEWQNAAVTGVLLLVGGNGLVVWGEQWVPSAQAALMVASVALWLALFGTLGRRGQRLDATTLAGLLIGFSGVALLLWPAQGLAFGPLAGQLALLGAALSWAIGSMYLRHRQPTTPALMGAGLQSLIAGVLLTAIGAAAGELPRWRWDREALLALAYLAVFGSCLAYAAYLWLLHEVRPATLGTYAYINPAIAVLLGVWLLDESLTGTELAGMLVILAGVALVTAGRRTERG